MDYFFPESSDIIIRNGLIDSIDRQGNTTFLTVTYTDRANRRRIEQTVRLVIGNNTRILDENGRNIPANELRTGMIINAVISSSMTRSIPPQASAFRIRIVSRPLPDNITVGRILDISRQNRSFTTISGGNIASIIRFNVPTDTMIFDRLGKPMDFSRLMSGMQVRVRHASFMTASIPPQTTAFEIRVM